nr:ORF1 [Torque teno Leptonychotes weddellii virus 1]WCS65485.1 ORF1 [Torque teno Leptonychotes weddellii virus 1]WCS65797.1 ORF1 [Torque teno Leptonychotes weddellii virus 1]
MAYRRRRYRRPRRSRYRGYRRRHYWRRRHGGRHRWWRRRSYRPRTATVRYYPSRRRKRISVRGWEPLGNVCAQDVASSEATPYNDLDMYDLDPRNNDCTGTNHGVWHGTWGHHYFTMRNLLIRAKYYFNYWSSDWEGYDYVSFKGGWIWIPRMPYFSWMFYADPMVQSNPKEGMPEAKYKFEKSWFHPGIFLNRPGAKLMLSSLQQPNRSFFRRIKIRPPSAWEGNYRIDVAMDYLLFHWAWTVTNVTASFFDFYCQRKRAQTATDTCPQTPWFICEKSNWDARTSWRADDSVKIAENNYVNIDRRKEDPRSAWVNRKAYLKSDCVNTPGAQGKIPANFHNWGPFLPQNVVLEHTTGNSIYFRYKLFFEVSGDSIYRRKPSQPCSDGVIPSAPGSEYPCPEIPTYPHPQKRKRKKTPPLSCYEILPGDLDSDGILTDRALERITRPDRCDQPTGVGDEPDRIPPRKRVRFRLPDRKQHRKLKLLRLLLGRRRESRGGGSPPSPPPIEEPLDLLLNFPK